MKQIILLSGLWIGLQAHVALAQSNTFPASGNVGIGTATPVTQLEVAQGNNVGGITVSGDARYVNPTVSLRRTDDSAGTGVIQYIGSDDSVDWAIGVNQNVAGSMEFMKGGLGSSSTRVIFDKDGNVGVGTNSPAYKLDVRGIARFGIANTTINNIGGVLVASGNGVGGARQYWIGASNPTSQDNNQFEISDWDGSTNFPLVTIYGAFMGANAGNVGIGTTNPTQKLSVNGTIQAKEVIVQSGWSDYVFGKDYKLAPLSQVERTIKTQHHLPGIPSAKEVAAKGVRVGEIEAKLLAKIEELTLRQIEQEKRLDGQAAQIERLERENQALRAKSSE